MKKFSTYLVIMFMVMFWIFRIIVALTNTIGINLGFTIYNYWSEVILLFITILSIILVFKRKILGAILYLLTYGGYFGIPLINGIKTLLNSNGVIDFNIYTELFVNFIAIVIPLFALFDLLLDKNRMEHPVDKKTDWFYKNEEYDRKMDDRADKNNYRTL